MSMTYSEYEDNSQADDYEREEDDRTALGQTLLLQPVQNRYVAVTIRRTSHTGQQKLHNTSDLQNPPKRLSFIPTSDKMLRKIPDA